MEGYEMNVYDDRSNKLDGDLTPLEPLLQESHEEPFTQSDGASSMYLKEPIVSSESLSREETPQASLLRQFYTAGSQKGWLTEILAFILALVALNAIVITLALHNGSTLPNWPFQISINALISIFGVILKGTIMVPVAEAIGQLKFVWYMQPNPLIHLSKFDLASRGPWGAFMLIITLRGRHLASLGAVITLLAMASDPFIQQVVSNHPCPQAVASSNASILRTNNYTYTDIQFGVGLNNLDPQMEAALYEGVYNSFLAIPATCSTGNCTFPHYRTVGVCSECTDISDTVNATCVGAAPAIECTYSLPETGLTLNMSKGDVMNLATTCVSPNFAISEIITFTEFLDYDKTDMVNNTDDIFSTPPDVMAVQCSLIPCVRTYSMEVVQNQNIEVLLNTSNMVQLVYTRPLGTVMPIPEIGPIGEFRSTPMPCLIDGIYYNATSFSEQIETNIWPIEGLLPNNSIAYLPTLCVFVYGNIEVNIDYLSTFLAGVVTEEPNQKNADPVWMAQLYNSGNATLQTINGTWAAIADSMTMAARKGGDPSSSVPAAGVVLQTDTCISVQWPWLIFPAALLFLTLVFLLATMAQSVKYTNRHVWKTSPLALLFHGMDQDLSYRYRLVDQLDEMEEKSSHTVVQIKDTEGGLRFVDAARK